MIPTSIPGSSGRLALRKEDLLLRSEERLLLNPGEKPAASGGQRNGDRPLLGAGCGCGALCTGSLRPPASNMTPLVGAVLAMLSVAVALLMTGAAASDR